MIAQPIRLLCVDDNEDILSALALASRRHRGVEYVGGSTTCDGLAEHVQSLRPHVVLVDLTMPGCDPLSAITQLSAQQPPVAVVAYSGYDDPQTRDSATRAGATDFVSKHEELETVMAVVRTAASRFPR